MSLCRDTIVSLWPASYRGVSFLFQIANEVHVLSFGMRELSERDGPHGVGHHDCPRIFEGFAFVTSNQADTVAIVESLATGVRGTLDVPEFGLVHIRCDTFERCPGRDRPGYICFAVKFVGTAAGAIVRASPCLVFDAADSVAAALASLFPASLSRGSGVDDIIDAAVYMVETVAASIELMRTTNLVQPDISIRVEAASAAVATAARPLITPIDLATNDVADLLAVSPPLDEVYSDPTATLGAVIVSTIRLLGAGMAGTADAGTGALLELVLDYPAVTNAEPVGANSAATAANSASIVDLARLAALVAWCEGLVRRPYASLSDAVGARANAAEWLGHELDHAARADNLVLYATLQNLRTAVIQYLTALIVELAPDVHGEPAIHAPDDDSVPIPFTPLISRRSTAARQAVSHFRGGVRVLSEDVATSRDKRQSAVAR
jgi:hypothetical protein